MFERSRNRICRTAPTMGLSFGLATTLVALIVAGPCMAQTSMFEALNADVDVVVTRTGVQFDNVDVTLIKPEYPPELLAEQVQRLGTELGSEVRGLRFEVKELGGERTSRFLRASFGVSGLVEPASGAIRLQAIARAFAGAPRDAQIDVISVTLLGYRPTSDTLRTHPGDSAMVEGRFNEEPAFLEYLIALRTQDREAIVIPDRFAPPPPPEPPRQESFNSTPLIVLLIVGAVAGGLLVYFAVLGSGSKQRRPR